MKKAFVIAYILFICMFAFLPKSVDTGVFILFIIVSAGYVFFQGHQLNIILRKNVDTRKLRRLFILFLYISFFYFLLSFLNLPKLWGIKGLPFQRSYIPRHFIIVAELFLPTCLGYFLYRIRFFDGIKTLPLLVFFLLLFFGINAICVKGVLLLALVLVSWKLDKKFLVLPAFFIFYAQTAYVLGYLALVFLIFLEKPITHYLYKNTVRQIVIFSLLAIVGIFLFSGFLAFFIDNDANSLWRLRVWTNEINSLAQTCFTGVGFGAAYVTEDIVYMVENSNMYIDDYGSIETGLFVVANHSSLVNMFYRMGIVGGIVFLAMNVQIIKLVIKYYHIGDTRQRALLWRLFAVWIYETIVIFLNPGLEMMQFAISYLLSLSVLFASLLVIQNRSPRKDVNTFYDQNENS